MSTNLFSIYGRVLVKGELEIKPLGIPFDGTNLLNTSWIDLGRTGYVLSISNIIDLIIIHCINGE